jgi:hypothetical protein
MLAHCLAVMVYMFVAVPMWENFFYSYSVDNGPSILGIFGIAIVLTPICILAARFQALPRNLIVAVSIWFVVYFALVYAGIWGELLRIQLTSAHIESPAGLIKQSPAALIAESFPFAATFGVINLFLVAPLWIAFRLILWREPVEALNTDNVSPS